MDHQAVAIIDQIIKNFNVNENKIRNGWKEGSVCEIFDTEKKKWFPGLILRVFIDEEGEWFEVGYEDATDEIQRFDDDIRPLMHNTAEDNEDQITEMKQRYDLKEGSFCEIYYLPEQKWYKAMIKRVFIDDRTECLDVLYGKAFSAEINRFDTDLRLPSTKDEEQSTRPPFSLDQNNSKANSMFEKSQSICNTFNKENIISNCSYLQRIRVALNHYERFCGNNSLNQSIDGKESFSRFCMESYHSLLDDYIHLITQHDDDLLKISNELQNEYGMKVNCSVDTCDKLRRHYGRRKQTKQFNDELECKHDGKIDFYCGYFDQIHHFLFHLFDIGIRSNHQQITESKNDTNDGINMDCHDKIFALTTDVVKSKSKKYDIDRYNQTNNKFNIKINNLQNSSVAKNGTCLDEIYSFVKNHE
eukprot:339063_1